MGFAMMVAETEFVRDPLVGTLTMVHETIGETTCPVKGEGALAEVTGPSTALAMTGRFT